MFNLSEGFDFNNALENDINDTIDTLSNNLIYKHLNHYQQKYYYYYF